MHGCAPLMVRERRLALEALVAQLAREGHQLRGFPVVAVAFIRLGLGDPLRIAVLRRRRRPGGLLGLPPLRVGGFLLQLLGLLVCLRAQNMQSACTLYVDNPCSGRPSRSMSPCPVLGRVCGIVRTVRLVVSKSEPCAEQSTLRDAALGGRSRRTSTKITMHATKQGSTAMRGTPDQAPGAR